MQVFKVKGLESGRLILDYPGGPRAATPVLESGEPSGLQKNESGRGTLPSLAGFENGGGDHKPRNVGDPTLNIKSYTG